MASTAFRVHGIGDCAVALAATSQLLKPAKIPVTFYGLSGDDSEASELRFALAQTPLDLTCFRQRPGSTSEMASKVDSGIMGEVYSQATLNLFSEVEGFSNLKQEFTQLLAKARHRGALTLVFSMQGLSLINENVDLLVTTQAAVVNTFPNLSFDAAVEKLFSQGLSSLVVQKSPTEFFYQSVGGIFGQANGAVNALDLFEPATLATDYFLEWPTADGNTSVTLSTQLFLSGLITHLLLQIHSDDFYPKGEVHVERELLQICPLRLHQALIFAVATQNQYLSLLSSSRHDLLETKKHSKSECLSTWKENFKGERLQSVQKLFEMVSPAGQPW